MAGTQVTSSRLRPPPPAQRAQHSRRGPETRVGGPPEPRTPPGRSWRPARPVCGDPTAPGLRAPHTRAPRAGGDRDPPAPDLAELGVRHLDLQREPRRPHGHLQAAVQVLVGEVDRRVHPAARLLPADKHVVAAAGHLCAGRGRGTSVSAASRRDSGGGGTWGVRPHPAAWGPRMERGGRGPPGAEPRAPVDPHGASCTGARPRRGTRGPVRRTQRVPRGCARGRTDKPSCVPAGARRAECPPTPLIPRHCGRRTGGHLSPAELASPVRPLSTTTSHTHPATCRLPLCNADGRKGQLSKPRAPLRVRFQPLCCPVGPRPMFLALASTVI